MTSKAQLRSLPMVMRGHSAEGFAAAIERRTFLIEGYDAAGCNEPTCDRAVAFDEMDADGPDARQPEGARCQFCHEFFCNAHGDRKALVCARCRA